MSQENQKKVCKHYVKHHSCKNGDDCKFQHIDNVCFHFFFKGKCKHGDQCKRSHKYVLDMSENKNNYENNENNNNKNKRKLLKRNTESFTPSHKSADMNMNFHTFNFNNPNDMYYPYPYRSNDVFIVKDLFSDIENIYQQLLHEIKQSGVDEKDIWKSWHGDNHLIADDHVKGKGDWKKNCPLFDEIIYRIKSYFEVDVKATRLNWYPDSSSWKPNHHDAAAIDPEKAKTQNVTISVSFGGKRDAIFEHAQTKTTVSIPQENGIIYGFCSKLNTEWRHGIPQIPPNEIGDKDENGRISIIVWGWVKEK